MHSEREFPELLVLLYSAPLEPDNWHRFLDKICSAADVPDCELLTRERGGAAKVDVVGGPRADLKIVQAYNEHFHHLDPFMEFLAHTGSVSVLPADACVPESDLKRSEFFNDFMLPNGIGAGTMATFSATPDLLEVLILGCHPDWRGPVPGYAQLLLRLLPHLRAAYGLRRVLMHGSARAVQAERALDQLSMAAFLLSASGEVLYQNTMATELVRQEDGICVRKGRLQTRDSQAQFQLEALIARAAQVAGATPGIPGGGLQLARSNRIALQVRVSPLRATGLGTPPGSVLVLVSDPERVSLPPNRLLQLVYGFTAREAEIARQLAAGLSPESIAAERQVSIGTVRAQIKQLLHKAGVRRQMDLIRQLLTFPGFVDEVSGGNAESALRWSTGSQV